MLDAGGHVVAVEREDGSSMKRFEIGFGKAHGALSLGMGSRSIMGRAEQQPYFIAAVTSAVGGALVPVPGGVLVRDAEGALLGAVGVTGDTSDNDEAAAVAGIEGAGLTAAGRLTDRMPTPALPRHRRRRRRWRASCSRADGVITDRARLRTYECDGLAHYRVTPALVVVPEDARAARRRRPRVRRARGALRRPRLRHGPVRRGAAARRGRADRDLEDARHHRRTP